NQTVGFAFANGTMNSVVYPMSAWRGGTTDTVIQKRWKDQFSVRVGGSYNVMPGLFGISLGAHYETRGVDPSYMQIDYWPVSRIGLHGGVKFRIGRTIDLVASYSHMFQETLVVGAPPTDPGGTDAISTRFSNTGVVDAIDKHSGVAATRGAAIPELVEPAMATDGVGKVQQVTTSVSQGRPPTIINAGTYRSSIDVVAVGVNIHF
ncbi:MAG TPA: hypothetical protein VFN67_16905, partial [Polyangiales bacterium]|nr:hypothetical protein [Polyangiales bacterium]